MWAGIWTSIQINPDWNDFFIIGVIAYEAFPKKGERNYRQFLSPLIFYEKMFLSGHSGKSAVGLVAAVTVKAYYFYLGIDRLRRGLARYP